VRSKSSPLASRTPKLMVRSPGKSSMIALIRSNANIVLPEPMPPVVNPHALTSSQSGTATVSSHVVVPKRTCGPG